jgi:pimeloyl-ACP methyl ester carboxylesterase
MSMRDAAGPQGRLAIDDAGTGATPVIFIHSDGGNSTHWREALDHLRPTRRATAVDLRGHGRSAAPANGDYSFAGRADDVEAAADVLGLTRFVLVGHSGGGAVALTYAARHPDHIAALLLVDSATDSRQFPEAQRRQFLEALRSDAYAKTVRDHFTSVAGPNAAVRDRVLRDVEATPQATIVGTFEALGTCDPAPALAAYRGPRLSLVTPLGDSAAALHRIDPTLPHRTVRGTGHWLHMDDPPAFARTLDEFLNQVP